MDQVHANVTHVNQRKNFLRCKEVQTRTSLSRSYIYQLSRQGKFPQPVELIPGGSSVAWIEEEINQWIEERINASRGNS